MWKRWRCRRAKIEPTFTQETNQESRSQDKDSFYNSEDIQEPRLTEARLLAINRPKPGRPPRDQRTNIQYKIRIPRK